MLKTKRTTNSWLLEFEDGVKQMKSYDVIIAEFRERELFIDGKYLNYSQTTKRHLRDFLSIVGESENFNYGKYKLKSLN